MNDDKKMILEYAKKALSPDNRRNGNVRPTFRCLLRIELAECGSGEEGVEGSVAMHLVVPRSADNDLGCSIYYDTNDKKEILEILSWIKKQVDG